MTPVMQTEVGKGGNCYSACLASLFDLPIESVPNFYTEAGHDPENWWRAVRSWLRARGYGVMSITVTTETLAKYEGFFIASGMGARGLSHATIWHEGKMVHDPHPDQSGISQVESVDMIYLLFTSEQTKGEQHV